MRGSDAAGGACGVPPARTPCAPATAADVVLRNSRRAIRLTASSPSAATRPSSAGLYPFLCPWSDSVYAPTAIKHEMIAGKMGELPVSELRSVENKLREILAL